MNSNFKNSIFILAAVVVVSGVGFGGYMLGRNVNEGTNAEQSQQTPSDANGSEDFRGGMPNGNMQGMDFSQFVEDGIIDQATADEMQAYIEKQMQDMKQNRQNGISGNRLDIFSGMVSEGIITQDQADQMQEAMPQMGNDNGQRMPPGGFNGTENGNGSL